MKSSFHRSFLLSGAVFFCGAAAIASTRATSPLPTSPVDAPATEKPTPTPAPAAKAAPAPKVAPTPKSMPGLKDVPEEKTNPVAKPAAAAKAAPVAKATPAPSATPIPTPVSAAPDLSPPAARPADFITININGRTVEADPAPLLRKGSVYVPLRGVLESLGAKVTYDTTSSRVDIDQAGKKYSMRAGQKYAISGPDIVPLSAAPISINGRAFVPLRALAELFGYRVDWLAPTRVVAISDKKEDKPTKPVIVANNPPEKEPEQTVDYQAALAQAGHFGVGVEFLDAETDPIKLLDTAKAAGATLVKFRFDWNALEPKKGGAFQWPFYDRIVREARERNLAVIGVLGNCTQWATRLKNSKNPLEWRNSAPVASELPAWDNYVKRVTGRYKNDVIAWQIWENPATYNFRAAQAKDYRIVARRATDIIHESNPKAVVMASEPGGINLGFVDDLARNGLLARVSGVSLYPVSQWQPGVTAQPEETVLPLYTLQKDTATRGEKYWVGGLSRLCLETPDLQGDRAETVFRTKDHEIRRRVALAFTPAAQADYLVRSMTISMAAGADKIFWANLRDQGDYELIDPVNSQLGGGLLRFDMTERPAYTAFTKLTEILAGKKYAGALSVGPRAIVLTFEDAKGEGSAVAWAIPGSGESRLILNTNADPGVPNTAYVQTEPDSKLLSSTGEELGGSAGSFTLTSRPVWITKVSFKVFRDLQDANSLSTPFKLVSGDATTFPSTGLNAVFDEGAAGVEEGLSWRKYLGFRGAATEFEQKDGMTGLITTFSRDPYNPAAGQPNIYLDVANDYMYFAHGAPVKVTVEVKRPPKAQGVFAPEGGFNIQYDSPSGFKSTHWQVVEGGDGWATYTFDLPDASFANRDGYDLLINTWGSRQDLIFRSLQLQKVETRAAQGEAQPAPQ